MADKYIGSFVHLKKRPKSVEALTLLKRVAAHVRPIMAARDFHVKTLAEFFPTQTNLLGTNYGKGIKVSLRLRPHYNDSEFMPFDDIIGTMLHELTHNVFGPHDAKFYAMLDDLNVEYDKLRSKGFKGDDGDLLGGRKLSIMEAKKASEARALRAARGTGQDGKKLGGNSISGTQSAEEVRRRVAEAAQRRFHDAKWCGHGRAEDPILVDEEEENVNEENEALPVASVQSVKDNKSALQKALGETRSVSKDKKVPEIIEIESDDDACPVSVSASTNVISRPIKRRQKADMETSEDYKRMKARGLLADTLYDHLKKVIPSTDSSASTASVPREKWACTICTLFNPLATATCNACGGERPSQSKFKTAQWKCEVCAVFNEQVRWMCRNCESIKRKS